mgnify:CR=1 FL=1
MIQIDGAVIKNLILHRAGSEEENSVFNDTTVSFEGEEEVIFRKVLLKPFVSQTQTFEFKHEVGIGYNVLFNLSKSLFEGEEEFIPLSQDILKHLLASSTHPNINSGDLFVAHFLGIKINNRELEGIGIYKFEDKESFIETTVADEQVRFSIRKGIGSKKPDKGVLILATEEPYTLFIIDNNGGETSYWQEDFINHRPKKDATNSTHHLMAMAKEFITEKFPSEFEVSKADQIDLLNRSANYFKKKELFDRDEFETEVFADPTVIDSFKTFDRSYREEKEVDVYDKFEIAPQTVKKQSRIFKSVLKLDKNFHIYIHGNRDLIEQGVDADGRKYYKIFYENES